MLPFLKFIEDSSVFTIYYK